MGIKKSAIALYGKVTATRKRGPCWSTERSVNTDKTPCVIYYRVTALTIILRDLELPEDYSLELVGALQTAACINYQAYQRAADPAEYEQSCKEWEARDEVRYNEYFKAYRR